MNLESAHPLVSQRAYAKRRGVTHEAVRKRTATVGGPIPVPRPGAAARGGSHWVGRDSGLVDASRRWVVGGGGRGPSLSVLLSHSVRALTDGRAIVVDHPLRRS